MAKTLTIAMYDGFHSHDGFDNYNGHDSNNKFSAPRQVRKGLVLLEDLLLADVSMVLYLQQCRYMVCKERACLEDLPGCRQPSG